MTIFLCAVTAVLLAIFHSLYQKRNRRYQHLMAMRCGAENLASDAITSGCISQYQYWVDRLHLIDNEIGSMVK